MAEQIALEVTRFSPERDTSPTVQSFDVPLRKEWVVLDALNYVKDKVDRSLRSAGPAAWGFAEAAE